jgi:DNA mismatch endonuclease (patch repair protein)
MTMVDNLTPAQRSHMMARIRGRDTGPERAVRSLLHRLGYRFRLHRRDLPGKPDIVLPKHRTVIQIHGCFWHRHAGCRRAYMPKSRVAFWQEKFAANVANDARTTAQLESLGWRVIVVWECELADDQRLAATLQRLLGP